MAQLYGTQFSKSDLLKRVGDISQIAGATRFEYTEGKAKGTAAIEIKNGSGLRFVVLPDRGMDIGYTECNGIAVSYISKTGVVNPLIMTKPTFSAVSSIFPWHSAGPCWQLYFAGSREICSPFPNMYICKSVISIMRGSCATLLNALLTKA